MYLTYDIYYCMMQANPVFPIPMRFPMKQEIRYLTDDMIRVHFLAALFARTDRARFVDVAVAKLEADIAAWAPERLGSTVCALEIGDVLASRDELLRPLTFAGDCKDTLREFVARCFAFLIRDRLDPHGPPDIRYEW